MFDFRRSAPALAVCAVLGAPTALAQPAPTAPAATPPAAKAPPYVPTSLKVDKGLPRTADGHPDFQGVVWESNFFALVQAIPLMMPSELTLPEDKAKAAFERLLVTFTSNPAIAMDPEAPQLFRDSKGFPIVRGQRRTRTLVLPTDGKLPMTAEAAKETGGGLLMPNLISDNPEQRTTMERCLDLGGALAPLSGPSPLHPRQFVQTKDYVALHTEYGDEVRIVPFAKVHGPAALQLPTGDAIARWEGDTLVIETTNFPMRDRVRGFPAGFIVNPDAKVIERFTQVTKDEIVYQFTVEDPKVYTAPWLGEYSIYRASYPMFPSHCHEGNYGLPNILAGARQEEQAVRDWMKVEKIAETTSMPAAQWTVWYGAGPIGMRAWSVMAPRNAAGEARVALRVEYAKPTAVDGFQALSEMMVFTIDCAGQRLKRVSASAYAAHNFTGDKHDQPASETWAAATTRPAIADGIAKACSAASTQVSQR